MFEPVPYNQCTYQKHRMPIVAPRSTCLELAEIGHMLPGVDQGLQRRIAVARQLRLCRMDHRDKTPGERGPPSRGRTCSGMPPGCGRPTPRRRIASSAAITGRGGGDSAEALGIQYRRWRKRRNIRAQGNNRSSAPLHLHRLVELARGRCAAAMRWLKYGAERSSTIRTPSTMTRRASSKT